MIPVLMLLFSAMALVQFFLSYCRALLAAYGNVEFSATTREVIGLDANQIHGGEFDRLLGLVRIAPNAGDSKWELGIVTAYYRFLSMIDMSVAQLVPVAQSWSERESTRCAYFAAAALDRRIAAITQ
ncbi:MAG TPA: hypothetical protein VNF02_06795 [Candidatus Limnocylindrales bacterium]|nr:hypothetical protein [Candidatus Limnocylindrales bacterium]